MPISIQTNVNSLVSQQNMNVNSTFQSKTIQQLTSGYRINQSGDDAAGLAVANKFRSSVAELTQGVANGNDGLAQLQIMDGGMSNISQILDRLKTLATQSASGAFTGIRADLNTEFQSDLAEIDRQAQSIGLNSSGLFAKSLDVYLGSGSGSSSLANGVVTLNLAASTVDAQSLGLKGMEVADVNLDASGNMTSVKHDLGTSQASSVQAIVNNNSNQQAVAGHAALQFSGAGFSDAGKVGISVNLDGVSDMGTLVIAVNNAIQGAAAGGTAAANAFKAANISASVYTDSNGGQALAFSSSTSAFQVQAGDQVGNALLGNVSGAGLGDTVTTSMQGAATTAGTGFATPANVHLVVTGGGLAQPVSLQLNSSSTTTGGAIADLVNQFGSTKALTDAGLSMVNSAGGSNLGGNLQFTSASGQSFNVQVTGDTQNMLGLGSFLTDAAGNADYKTITSASYSAAAVTNNLTTTGTAAGLEVSLNGQQSVALNPIDLMAGAHAQEASVTSTAAITGGAQDIDLTNQNVDITITNNGVATHSQFTLSPNQAATAATALGTMTGAGYSSTTVSAASFNNSFTVSLNGGAATTVTIADGTYADKDAYLTAVQGALTTAGITTSQVTASWASGGTGVLTLSDATGTTGTSSSVAIALATTDSKGSVSSTVAGMTKASFAGFTTAANNDTFMVSLDGAPAQAVKVSDTTYTAGGTQADLFLTDLQSKLHTVFGATGGTDNVIASWAPATPGGAATGELTLTSSTVSASSSVAVSAATYDTHAKAQSTALGAGGGSDALTSPIIVNAANHNNKFAISVDGGASTTVTVADGTYSLGSTLLAAISGTPAGVTAAFDTASGKLTFTSNGATKGVADTVTLSAVNEATSGRVASTTLTQTSVNTGFVVTGGSDDSFKVALNGGAATVVTVAADDYTGNASGFLTAVQNGLNGALGTNTVIAGWDAITGALTLTSAATGTGSQVTISQNAAITGNTHFGLNTLSSTGSNSAANTGLGHLNLSPATSTGATLTDTGLGTVKLDSGNTATVSGYTAHANSGLSHLLGAGTVANVARGIADNPTTLQSIVGQLQAGIGGSGTVTANSNGTFTIKSTSKGANSAVVVNTPGTNPANTLLNLTGATPVAGLNSSLQDIVDNLNAQFGTNSALQAAGLHASITDANGAQSGTLDRITIASAANNNTQFRLNATGAGAVAVESIGFGKAGATFQAANPNAVSTMSTAEAYGASATSVQSFNALKYGNESQVLTFSAADGSGALETKSITLQNNASTNRAGRSVDDAVAYINQVLQASGTTPALQGIVAVKELSSGQEAIKFVSALPSFTVGVGAVNTGSTDGLNGGAQAFLKGQVNGSAANMSVATQDGAKAAVSAVSAAVAKLGSAQAAVGKGENQLSYAINLAQSQITNFSAAESQIRDANIAQQAANLTKAQVLQQATIAAMAQANSAPQAVLKLLQG